VISDDGPNSFFLALRRACTIFSIYCQYSSWLLLFHYVIIWNIY